MSLDEKIGSELEDQFGAIINKSFNLVCNTIFEFPFSAKLDFEAQTIKASNELFNKFADLCLDPEEEIYEFSELSAPEKVSIQAYSAYKLFLAGACNK